MKKILALGLTLALLIPTLAAANAVGPEPTTQKLPKETLEDEEPAGTMTVQSFQWLPEIVTDGENKLLKAKADFHYEGDFITLGSDYYFSVSCMAPRQKRRGGYKTLYEETRDLSILDDEDMEIEGPHDFSLTFTFTFFPQEFTAAQKRGITCNISPSGNYGKGGRMAGQTVTKFPEGLKTYDIRIRPKNGVWTVR